MSELTPDFIQQLKALAIDAQQAREKLLKHAKGQLSARREEENHWERTLQNFEHAANPAVVLEILKRLEESQQLSDKAIETVQKMTNSAMALEKSVDDLRKHVGQYIEGAN